METHIYGKGQCGLLLRLYNMIKWSSESTDLLRTSIHVMRCTFGTIDTIKKNMKSTHGRVLLLVKLPAKNLQL